MLVLGWMMISVLIRVMVMLMIWCMLMVLFRKIVVVSVISIGLIFMIVVVLVSLICCSVVKNSLMEYSCIIVCMICILGCLVCSVWGNVFCMIRSISVRLDIKCI